MGRAKDIIVKVIPAKVANDFVRRYHYSGKVVNNSSLHFGAFLNGVLHGVMSYGSPLDKRKVLPLVYTAEGVPCLWNEMLELNRMAFDDVLPKNSESRCIAVSFKLIRKNAPHIRWILSFSDGTQCGDGAIYRASGFVLTSIKKNDQIWQAETGEKFSRTSLTDGRSKRQQIAAIKISRGYATKGKNIIHSGASSMKSFKDAGFVPIPGYQLRYIYLIDKTCKITVPIIPFSKIDEIGAGMYKGEKITLAERRQHALQALTDDATGIPAGEGVRYDRSAQIKST